MMAKSLPPVAPRLCSCDAHTGGFVDRSVQDIEIFVHKEMKALHDGRRTSRKERFSVFKKAFGMLIDESTNFKTLLAEINAEYLAVIAAVEKGVQDRAYISRDLKCVLGGESTIENYEKRIQDLKYKAKLIKENNEQLRVKCEQWGQEDTLSSNNEKSEISKTLIKQSSLVLPGLKMQDQTDVQVLSSCLAKLRQDVKSLEERTKTNYLPKERKSLLEKDMQKKETSQTRVSRYNDALRERLGKLTVAVEVAKSISLSSNHILKRDFADVILKAINDYEKMDSSRKLDPLQQHISATDDDDPSKKKESEKLLSYVEHFNDLFDFGQYEAAAIHAATSPMAILRTPQAMQKFKEVEVFNGVKSPLFLYCEALMSTSVKDCGNESFKLTAGMSVECTACALKESGINLAIHWLNHPCIVTSISLADLLVEWCQCVGDCSCKCQAIAEGIYREYAAHQQVANTLARQGKHRAVIEYGRTHGGFQTSDYKAILQSNPTVFYANMLLQANLNNKKTKGGISFCCILNILLENNEQVLLQLLQFLHSTGIYDSKGLKHSIGDLIFEEKYSDGMTTEKWNRVVELCSSNNSGEIAMEILSTLLVRQALHHASIYSSMDYIS